MKELMIYFKKVDTKDNRSFKKYFAVYKENTFLCNFTKEARIKLEAVANAKRLENPYIMGIENDDQYFITKETYTKKDGSKGENIVIVIKDFKDVTQGFFKGVTLDDVVKSK